VLILCSINTHCFPFQTKWVYIEWVDVVPFVCYTLTNCNYTFCSLSYLCSYIDFLCSCFLDLSICHPPLYLKVWCFMRRQKFCPMPSAEPGWSGVPFVCTLPINPFPVYHVWCYQVGTWHPSTHYNPSCKQSMRSCQVGA